MIASLALALVLGQGVVPGLRGRVCHDELGEGSLCGWGYVQLPLVKAPAYAFFEFAPADGAGMGTACSGAAVTGAKGEALTFTRASTATCTKGNPVSGIQPGDLVTVTNDQPRVGNPDGLGLALLVEKMAQNVALQSEALDAAPWAVFAVGVANPTVTANQALSPFNTMTAERLQIPATTAAQASFVYQTVATGAVSTHSVFLLGNAMSGTIDVCAQTGTYACTSCAFVSTSITRCQVTSLGAVSQLQIGNFSAFNGGIARAAADVFVWGAQLELGTYATSYIHTTSAAVTRAADRADVALAFAPTAGLSVAGTSITPSNASWNPGGSAPGPVLTIGALGSDINGTVYWWPYTAAGPALAADSTGVVSAGLATFNPSFGAFPSTTMRVAAYHTGTKIGVCQTGSACVESGSSTFGTPSFTRVMIGHSSANPINDATAYFRNLCVDPSPTRCR